jgi:tetratricopeptide (TPR) repeat protein
MPRGLLVAMTTTAALAGFLLGVTGQPVLADQDDPRLDGLFQRLQTASNPAAALVLEHQIWRIWGETEDAAVQRLMQQGVSLMHGRQLGEALTSFDRLVDRAPDFAEGWNKRATVHYLLGNYRASVLDIQRTLALEPRHFGALSGLGLIYDALEEPAAALRSYEAALALNPLSGNTRSRIEQLRRELRGRRT